ncbi:MAG TPA: pyridoxal-phosphate dependent enzyme, partial [bacterium]|nr:pyridoxal-phosphate dependent enzyme [bacterium]
LKVVIYGETYQESFLYARQVAEREGMVFIHGFDDPLIISGQGTVALEIMEELPETGLIVVPVGGGGLVAGVLAAVKERHPRVKVVGVQASGAPSMYRSWQTGQVFEIAQIKTMAEGIAVKKPGQLTFELVRRWIDDIVLVTEEEIREGMLTLLRDGRVLAEAAGAVSVAAFLARKIKAAEKTVCVVSGGNVELKNLLKPGEEEDGHKN